MVIYSDFPIKMVMFHTYVGLPKGTCIMQYSVGQRLESVFILWKSSPNGPTVQVIELLQFTRI